MEKLLIEEFAAFEDRERLTYDRLPEMPLLGFLTGSIFSLAIWLGALWIALKLVG